jgi:hypothetical protein
VNCMIELQYIHYYGVICHGICGVSGCGQDLSYG